MPSFRALSKLPPCPALPSRLAHLHTAGPGADRSHKHVWSRWLLSSIISPDRICPTELKQPQRRLCTRTLSAVFRRCQPIRTVFGVRLIFQSFFFLPYFPAAPWSCTVQQQAQFRPHVPARRINPRINVQSPPLAAVCLESLCVMVVVLVVCEAMVGANRLRGSVPHNKL